MSAGHALRWRLLTALAHTDATVEELTTRVGEPQNLVSYHLRKLRDAGFVRARRSSADGRDRYYSADLSQIRDALVATGLSLHPGLQLVPSTTPPASAPAGRARLRALFLCTGNSARSQMAEALVALRSRGLVEAASAGSNPKPLHPNAIRVMREQYGVDISRARSKHLDAVVDQRFARVITLCDKVREVCPEFPGAPDSVHWSFADPAAGGASDDATRPAFEQLAAALDARIEFLLPELLQRTAA